MDPRESLFVCQCPRITPAHLCSSQTHLGKKHSTQPNPALLGPLFSFSALPRRLATSRCRLWWPVGSPFGLRSCGRPLFDLFFSIFCRIMVGATAMWMLVSYPSFAPPPFSLISRPVEASQAPPPLQRYPPFRENSDNSVSRRLSIRPKPPRPSGRMRNPWEDLQALQPWAANSATMAALRSHSVFL